ncbi:MAG: PorT family protein, partial [Muribaculaceae bacterium]|nr:PorT family protein [Muribaculaceae bacterium]
MKRLLFSVLLIGISIASAVAQTHFDSRVDIGVKGGVTFSEVMFKPAIIQKFGIGETAGITFRYSEENHFGLIAEVNLVQRGWAEKFENLPY